MIFLSLFNNITLLLSLSVLYSLISRRWDYTNIWHKVFAGVLFGLVAIVGMLNPLYLQPGVIFDGRSIILSIGGLFGGGVTAIIATLISSSYRIYLGGAGSIMGVSVIVSSSAIGVAYHYIRSKNRKATQIVYLYVFGVVVHLIMLLLTSTLPSNTSVEVLKAVAIPVIIIYPLASLLICLLFLQHESKQKVSKALRESEENYRLLVEKASSIIVKLDSNGRIVFINSFAQDLLGYNLNELMGKFAIGSVIQKESTSFREFAQIIDYLLQNPDKHAFSETQVVCKYGEIKWISWTYKVLADEKKPNLLEILCVGTEITQKKKAELALHESEKKYRLLYDSLIDGYVKVDMGGRINDCNHAFEEITGYSKEELFKLTYIDLTPSRWHKFEKEQMNDDFYKNGYTQPYEKEFIKKSGEVISVELRTYLCSDNEHGPTAMWAIVRDITHRKTVENELIKSEEKYRTIIELAADTILLGNSNGNIIGANLKATELTGYSIEELIGKNITSLFSKQVLEKNPLQYDALKEGKALITERLICRKDGSEVPIEMNSKLMPHNTYISMIRDITERKHTLEALKQNEERFRTVVTSTPMVTFTLDLQGIFTFSEGLGLSKIGLKPGQVVGLSVYDVYKDYPKISKTIKTVFNKGETIREDITVNGITFDTLFSPIKDENNEVKGIIGVATDITDRKLAEQKIIESKQLLKNQNAEYIALNEELNESNQRIREINDKLIQTTEKAQESERLKSSFLANMSHEIRTPMNGVIGFSELLLRPDISKVDQRKYIEIIIKSSKQLLSIINDIIDISKIEAEQIVINRNVVNIDSVVTDTFNLFAESAKSKNVCLFCSIPKKGKETIINTDEIKLKQILMNLANNALKFTEKGNVEIGYTIKDSVIELYVKDSGIGIDPKNHSLIFERFLQVEGDNHSSIKGTGLGLAISKSLVELLGGEIWVESKRGNGATFYFTLPID